MPITPPNSKPKYQIRIDENGRYDWTALVVDMTKEQPDAASLHARSLAELLTKATVALMLRDKNVGSTVPEADTPETPPVILAPPPRIITPPN